MTKRRYPGNFEAPKAQSFATFFQQLSDNIGNWSKCRQKDLQNQIGLLQSRQETLQNQIGLLQSSRKNMESILRLRLKQNGSAYDPTPEK